MLVILGNALRVSDDWRSLLERFRREPLSVELVAITNQIEEFLVAPQQEQLKSGPSQMVDSYAHAIVHAMYAPVSELPRR